MSAVVLPFRMKTDHAVSVRFPIRDVDLLRAVVKARGEGVSSFVRRAVYVALVELGFVGEDRAKALGLLRGDGP